MFIFYPKIGELKIGLWQDFFLPADLFGSGDVCKNLGPGISVFFLNL